MRPERSASVLSALAVAAIAGLAGAPEPPGIPLGSLGYFSPPRLQSQSFGPFSTATNHGYESSLRISPIVPGSYSAKRSPQLYAVQFIGDDPENLKRDHLVIALASGQHPWPFRPLDFTRYDLVGYPARAIHCPQSIAAQFSADRFNQPPSRWRVHVTPEALELGRPSAYAETTLAALNAYRTILGESTLDYNRDLAWASQAHADYLAVNGYDAPSFHDEQEDRRHFTGDNPWNRDMTFGWPSSLTGEVGIEWCQQMPAPIVIQNLIDTVYHRLDLLSDNLYSEGEGVSFGKTGAVVMDLGFGYGDSLPRAVVYPYPGEVGLPIFWTDLESPNPMPGGFGRVYGYPLTVDIPTAARLDHIVFSLDQGRRSIPAFVDPAGQGDMDGNQVGLVPDLPLPAETVLTAHFLARAVFQDGEVKPIRLVWQFATGGAAISVAAVPQARGQVKIAVASTGEGIAFAREPVAIYQGVHIVATGITNSQGEVALRVPGPGIYLAKAATGNAVEFQEGDANA